MYDKEYLLIPGPTPLPPAVLRQLARPMINHRGAAFGEMYRRVLDGLKPLFGTREPITMLTSSGTGGLEAAAVNLIAPGDRVLAVVTGVFGARWASIAERFGAEVERLTFPAGQAADPEEIGRALAARPAVKAVLLTHNETSTGIMNDLDAIAPVVRKGSDALLLVDAISSLGAVPVDMDELGLDAVVTGSQKALMNPPGLAFIALSPRAWAAAEACPTPRFYFDLITARKFDAKGQTPWTPAVNVVFGVDAALQLIAAEGLPAVYERHQQLALAVRAGASALGLELLAADSHYSRTVTAIHGPAGIDVQELRKRIRQRHGVVLAGGQRELEGKIFRIGHLGYMDRFDTLTALAALEEELLGMGVRVTRGAALAAAQLAFASRQEVEVGA